MLLNLELEFRPELSAGEVADAVDRVERSIRQRYPQIKRIFIEAKSLASARVIPDQH